MTNLKAFSLLNIIILICFLSLGGIALNSFYKKNNPPAQIENKPIITESVQRDFIKIADSNEISSELKKETKTKTSALPDPNTLPTLRARTFNTDMNETNQSEENNGHFVNEKYSYSFDFPKDWLLKSEQLDNITIGMIPPKDGIAAMNIQIGSDDQAEVNKLKQEVKKYPGTLALEETSSVIGGEDAQMFIVNNLLNQTKNYYLIFSHNNFGYIIKFPYQSEKFYNQISEVLKSFEFESR